MNLIATVISIITFFTTYLPSTDVVYLNDADEYIEEYVYCSVDASAVSLGEVIPLEEIAFNGENCAELFINLIESNGLESIYSGSIDEDFYLSAISGIDTSTAYISEEFKEILIANSIDYENAVWEENVLGDFDFTESSGWIYTVNGEIPDVGMNSYIPQVGDEIKLVFTLCYGEDIYLLN